MKNSAIQVENLTKKFNGFTAVDQISFTVKTGELFGLLGPNGAGKTTTINMLSTLLKTTSGYGEVSGYDISKNKDNIRRSIGVVFQEPALDIKLTGKENLEFHAMMYGIEKEERKKRIKEVLELVELTEKEKVLVEKYSGGMKRRLEIARGLIHEPNVLFLDEPTLGLDPQNRAGIWDYIRELKEQRGMTLLLTTHYMDEAEKLADQVGIIDHGRIAIEGTPRELIDQMGADVIHIEGQGDKDTFVKHIEALPFVQSVSRGNSVIQIGVDSGNRRLVEVVTVANNSAFTIEDISVTKPSLGDVFLKYTGRQFRDE